MKKYQQKRKEERENEKMSAWNEIFHINRITHRYIHHRNTGGIAFTDFKKSKRQGAVPRLSK